MTAGVGEEKPLGEQDRARARRRYAAYAGAAAALLLLAGVLLSRHPGGTDAFGVVTFGYGLGVAVAAILLALGWEPRRRKK
jgi:peptidoglycan/LPS O-acetylase OafA/YrhL